MCQYYQYWYASLCSNTITYILTNIRKLQISSHFFMKPTCLTLRIESHIFSSFFVLMTIFNHLFWLKLLNLAYQ